MSEQMRHFMNDNEHQIGDLIQLFLDGESTDIENELLFSALAGSKAAQAEFQSAVQAGTLLRTVAQSQQPPVELSALVMEKVGFSVSTTTSIATTGAEAGAVTAAGTGFSTLFQSLSSTLQLGKILSWIGLIAIGSLGTVMFNQWQDSRGTNAALPASSSVSTTDAGLQSPTPPQTETTSAVTETKASNPLPATNTATNTATREHPYSNEETTFGKERDEAGTTSNVASENAASQHSAMREMKQHAFSNRKEKRSASLTNKEAQTEGIAFNTQEMTPQEISAVALQDEERLSLASTAPATSLLQPSSLPSGVSYIKPDTSGDDVDMIPDAVWMRTMGALRHYPVRTETQQSNFGDIDFCMLFKIGGNFSMGMEFGNEFLPSFVPTNSGSLTTYTLQSRIAWGGATLWYDMPHTLLLNDLHYFGSVSLGQSSAGPIFKAQTGVYYNLFDAFRVGASVDGTVVAFQSTSGWQSAGRNGASLMVGYQF